MSEIEIRHKLEKGRFKLDVDVRVPGSGITGVFGESGCGKTTLLRCIAGLEKSSPPDTRPAHERGVGMVFQEPSLFMHLSVRRNIEYGWRRNKDVRADLQHIIGLLGLDGVLDRAATSLSGGEAQRVAIARALAQSPRLILMDEPLSSLDQRRRSEILPYFDRLHEEVSLPVIYVSHDIEEIGRICDHLLIMDEGHIVAGGALQDVLMRIDLPQLSGKNAGVAIEATPLRHDEKFDLTIFEFSGGELCAPGKFDRGANLRLRINASDVSLCRKMPESTTILNVLPAQIDAIESETKATALLRLKVAQDFVVARITNRSLSELNLRVGESVYAQIKSVTVRR